MVRLVKNRIKKWKFLADTKFRPRNGRQTGRVENSLTVDTIDETVPQNEFTRVQFLHGSVRLTRGYQLEHPLSIVCSDDFRIGQVFLYCRFKTVAFIGCDDFVCKSGCITYVRT